MLFPTPATLNTQNRGVKDGYYLFDSPLIADYRRPV